MPAPDRAASDRGIDSDFPVFGLMIEPLFHISCRWKSARFSASSVPDADIAREMNLVRSTIHEHRTRSLEILRKIMEGIADEKDV